MRVSHEVENAKASEERVTWRGTPEPNAEQDATRAKSHTWSSSKMLTFNERMEVCTRQRGGGIISSSVKVCRRFLIRKPVCNQQVAKSALSEQNKLLQTFVFGIQIFQSNLFQTLQKASQKLLRLLGKYQRLNGALVFSLCRCFVLSCSLTLMNQ